MDSERGFRRCARCAQDFPLSENVFYVFPAGKIDSYCNSCRNIMKRERRTRDPEKTRESTRRSVTKFRLNNPEYYEAYQRQWAAENPDKVATYRDRQIEKNRLTNFRVKSKYGITPDQVEGLREFQQGLCPLCEKPICRFPTEGERKEFIDHDHATGYVRGLLCPQCNSFLGWLEKRRDRITTYLDTPPAAQVGIKCTTPRLQEDARRLRGDN